MTQPDGIPGATVALLRGVNVGGNNRLAMKDLTEVFRVAGCKDVTTYIQSGNVVFTAHPDMCSRIPDLVANLILARHDIRTTAVLRTGLELTDVLGNNPFLPVAASEDHLHVLFLADAPPEDLLHALDFLPSFLPLSARDKALCYTRYQQNDRLNWMPI
jgi:uncharacterized protein (DUF1697 family)